MTDHVPVVVIGSGPTGLTLANLLGRAGVGALLVERNLHTVQEPRAVSIDDESLRTMQAVGIVDAVLATVVPGYGSHYHGPDGSCFATVEPMGQPYGYPRRNAFRQPVLEQQLRDALLADAHVTPLFGWRLDAFTQDADRVALTIAGPDGETRRLTCDYLVGCDGASSAVRERIGQKLAGTTFDERWLIVDLERHPNPERFTKVFCDISRPCITLPGPDDTRRFEFKLHPHETDAAMLAPAMIDRLLSSHGADPQATLRRKVVYRFHARVAPRWSQGRVFLAGDAAHLTPPFAGQGMNSGLRDAHNLAWKLAAVLQRRLGPALLDSYERERSDHVWQMVQLALRMGRVMSPRSRMTGLLTRLGFRSLRVWPPARDYVAQMRYKPKPRFHAGFLASDDRGARKSRMRKSLAGRLFPQPFVRDAAGALIRLDAVLGDGFALLMRTATPGESFGRLPPTRWDALGARRVAILPADAPAPPPTPGIAVVRETDDVAALALAPYAGRVLLLRPDHYVAGSMAPDAGDALDGLIDATWTAAQTGGDGPRCPASATETRHDRPALLAHAERPQGHAVPGGGGG